MKHHFFRIPVLFINFADANRNDSRVSLFTLLMEREFFKYPNRFILQCVNGMHRRCMGAFIFRIIAVLHSHV